MVSTSRTLIPGATVSTTRPVCGPTRASTIHSADRGNCDQDIRHRNVLSYIYELPLYKDQNGFAGKVLGGWQISGVTVLQTGTPFNITEPTDRSLSGAGSDRPDFVGSTKCSSSIHAIPTQRMVDRIAASTEPVVAVQRPLLIRSSGALDPVLVSSLPLVCSARTIRQSRSKRVPWTWRHDLRLHDDEAHQVGENKVIEFRSEFFNIFNHANFGNPNGNIGSANFGRITTTRDPRLIQFALKFQF